MILTRHEPVVNILPNPGAVAQLGERMNGIHEVVGSIPSSSTKKINKNSRLGNS